MKRRFNVIEGVREMPLPTKIIKIHDLPFLIRVLISLALTVLIIVSLLLYGFQALAIALAALLCWMWKDFLDVDIVGPFTRSTLDRALSDADVEPMMNLNVDEFDKNILNDIKSEIIVSSSD